MGIFSFRFIRAAARPMPRLAVSHISNVHPAALVANELIFAFDALVRIYALVVRPVLGKQGQYWPLSVGRVVRLRMARMQFDVHLRVEIATYNSLLNVHLRCATTAVDTV